MQNIGIVAEYNPFHTGHGYQISRSKALAGGDASVVTVMSGNWVQQADCAIADKWTRARLALLGGSDLVLELPTVWATASAESFARGAVSILEASGVVDLLSFGSECGSVDRLQQTARCLDSQEYRELLAHLLEQGLSFPAARQKAVQQLDPHAGALLSNANNNLGVEYLRALDALHSTIRPITVTREGAGHNTLSDLGSVPFVSATQIRLALRSGDWDSIIPYLVPGGHTLLKETALSSLSRIERAVLARLRTMTAEDWAGLPDSGQAEGLPRRLERAGHQAASLEEFFSLAKTRRYTHARIRRLALWAYLGLTREDFLLHPPYIRVLGFNTRGRELLKQMKQKASLPILTKPAHARALDGPGQRLFELEARCTDLYDLCLDPIPSPGREWTSGPVLLLNS